MSDDAVEQLRRAISTPVNTMTVVTVESSKQAGDILRIVAEGLHNRPWIELPMPCTEGAVGTLLRMARQFTETWPPEEGVIFLSDDTLPNRRPEEGVEFWRAMNLQRENWAGLNCHLVFLLTLQNYEQLLTVADHLASWIPIKLDARQSRKKYPIIGDANAVGTEPEFRDQDVTLARHYLAELEQGLAKAMQEYEDDSPTLLLRRYYLPMMEAALKANQLERADAIGKNVNPDDVPDSDKPRWWQARYNTFIRLFRFDEARMEAERYLHWAQRNQNVQEEGNACIALGEILRITGNFTVARPYLEQALKIREVVFGQDHPNVAIVANYLGLLLWALGELPEAQVHFERAITILERTYGPDHPEVSSVINNLAGVLRDLGDLGGARAYYERSLYIDSKVYGPENPAISRNLNNMGLVLRDLGDLAGARANFERAKLTDEATYGPDSPGVAVALVNLGKLLWQDGDLSGAREHLEKALRIDEATFGPDHPNVGRDVNNLGGVLLEMGDFDEAQVHIERALKIDEAAYGPSHPNVARDLKNLGMVLKAMGDMAGARVCYEQALVISKKFFGDDHHNTKSIADDLSALDT